MNLYGYWAVKFLGEGGGEQIRITDCRTDNPLAAIDNVLGTHYAAERPMIIDILHDFSRVRVKMIARTLTELRIDKRRRAAIDSAEGWVQPSYSQDRVDAARRQLERRRKENR